MDMDRAGASISLLFPPAVTILVWLNGSVSGAETDEAAGVITYLLVIT